MKNISDIPYDEEVKINKNSKVAYASSLGVGGVNDEIRIIICDKKLITDENGFKLINESDLQIVMNKKTAKDLISLLEQYTH
ncbi:MAG: hypothetical protein IJL02_07295 [Methanobrevibacter sp.]|uniref:hypothetical protein n=1 Tax=Methanobrevibacter sp. TaxID=66852 RepID=UPI0025D599D2|nr:hypothetical protein [Methanobrevibacter sp.]MBQ6099651.1 hypothetical protein [Methanobrevibacter sp.]